MAARSVVLPVLATVLIGFATAAMALPALADGKKDCTTEPQAKWQKQADAESAAKNAGYEVRRSKVEGKCYEVYAVKDDALYELFYNPKTSMLFGDAKTSLTQLIGEMKNV